MGGVEVGEGGEKKNKKKEYLFDKHAFAPISI